MGIYFKTTAKVEEEQANPHETFTLLAHLPKTFFPVVSFSFGNRQTEVRDQLMNAHRFDDFAWFSFVQRAAGEVEVLLSWWRHREDAGRSVLEQRNALRAVHVGVKQRDDLPHVRAACNAPREQH